jgi:hypothetical protein
MGEQIIYSLKQYQEGYTLRLEAFKNWYEDSEELDFIKIEIQEYSINLKIVNLPITQVFSKWFRVEVGSPLKTFSISEEAYNLIFENENQNSYYKIYRDVYDDFKVSSQDAEIKIKQARLSFTKIITFLETKKNEAVLFKQNHGHKVDYVVKIEKELHKNIFIGNAFEVFEKYVNQKNLTGSCRVDFRLLFELLKNDSLFVDTVELKHYIKWLNKFKYYEAIELKSIDIKSRPNIQRANDYKEFKETTLKLP